MGGLSESRITRIKTDFTEEVGEGRGGAIEIVGDRESGRGSDGKRQVKVGIAEVKREY